MWPSRRKPVVFRNGAFDLGLPRLPLPLPGDRDENEGSIDVESSSAINLSFSSCSCRSRSCMLCAKAKEGSPFSENRLFRFPSLLLPLFPSLLLLLLPLRLLLLLLSFLDDGDDDDDDDDEPSLFTRSMGDEGLAELVPKNCARASLASITWRAFCFLVWRLRLGGETISTSLILSSLIYDD